MVTTLQNRCGRHVVVALLLGLGAVNLAGCGHGFGLTDKELVARAKDYQDKGDLKAAKIELKNALTKNANNTEARWLLAQIAVNTGDGASAEKEIKKALELGLPRTTALPMLVKAILLQADLDRVLTESSTLPADMPQSERVAILALRGQALVMKGQFNQAGQVLQQALAMKADSNPAHVGMALLHASQRDYDAARRELGLAIKADPGAPEEWSLLGDVELAQGHPAEAEKAFSQAIKIRNLPSIELARRALVRIQLKKFKEADADIDALNKQGWDKQPYVSYVAGLSYFAQSKYPKALSAFETSFAGNPSFIPNQFYLATTHFRLGHLEQALSFAQQLNAEMLGSPTAEHLLGAIQISSSDYGAARDLLLATLKRNPADPTTLNMLANLSMLEGDTGKGVEYARRVAALNPNSKQSQSMLMVAKLIAGQRLDQQIGAAGNQATAKGDEYTVELLQALEAFRNGKIGNALARAKKLHERSPDKADPIKLMAACYLAAGQWDKAKPELEQVLKLTPNDASVIESLAKVEAQGGNLSRSKSLLQALVKEQPDDEQAALLLADTEAALKNQTAAISVLEQTVQHNSNALAARAKLTEAYLQSGNIAKALETTRDLTNTQFQKQPALAELRGKALMLSGDVVSAQKAFEQLTKLMPDSAPAHFYYSDSLARSGDIQRAHKELVRSVQLGPKYLPARIGEIKLLVSSGEIEKAKKTLVKLRQDFGGRVEVLGIEGWFALGTRDYVTAEQRLSAALKQNPDTDLAILLVRAQWVQNKRDQAQETMRAWLQNHPQDIAMLLHQAGAYIELKRNDEAISTYNKVIKLNPNYFPALNDLAWLYRDKDLKKAIEYAQHANQLAPKDPHVLDTLGMLTLQSGDLPQANRLIQNAAELAPGDPQIQLHLGKVLYQGKRFSEASKVLDSLIKKAPGSPSAKDAKKLLDAINIDNH